MPSRETHESTPSSSDGGLSLGVFNAAKRQPYFLGSDNIVDAVEWVRSNRGGRFLVEKDSGIEGRAPQRAEFLIVGKISSNQYYLTPEGGWSPMHSAMYDRTFCQSKSTARIIRPDDEAYASVWDKTVENAICIMRSSLRRPLGNALVAADTNGGLYMPICHSIFDSYNTEAEFQLAYDDQKENCPDERLLMENWECTSLEAQSALHELIASNNNPHVSPKYLGCAIPVHTTDGALVLPHAYETVLRGATAVIGFHVLHQVMPGADRIVQQTTQLGNVPRVYEDHFFADITSITVLDPLN